MSTYPQRLENMRKVLNSSVITLGEIVSISYHWWRFETALIKRDAAIKSARKHAKAYNEKIDVVSFREMLQDL